MGLIKKQIRLISGGTYNFNILLTADIKDLGVFDTFDDTEMDGQVTENVARTDPKYTGTGSTFAYSFNYPSTHYNFLNYHESGVTITTGHTVIGTSSSRLSELRKYSVSGGLSTLYITANTSTVNGLDLAFTFTGATASTYQYYLGGITYIDSIVSPATAFTTTFMFISSGTSNPYNFDNKRYIKIEEKQNLVENTQVSSDVFIDRQEQSAFERNYRLRAINSLNNVLTYGGGNYFTIYNNT